MCTGLFPRSKVTTKKRKVDNSGNEVEDMTTERDERDTYFTWISSFQRNCGTVLYIYTDHVTIPSRFELLLCSLKRAWASMKMSNFEIKYSPGYCHMICVGKSKSTSEKGLFNLYQLV